MSALAYLPDATFSNAGLVSGSRDATVGVWGDLFPGGARSPTWEMTRQLKGHQYQVTAVAVLPDAESGDEVGTAIVSTSLDKTVRIWNGEGQCTATLQGHDGAVLSLAVISPLHTSTHEASQNIYLVTGSGDCTIRLWSLTKSTTKSTVDGQPMQRYDATCIDTIRAHTDSVRCLACIPGGTGFVSASHDGTIKVWEVDMDNVNGTAHGSGPTVVLCRDLVGHTALVYSSSISPDGTLVVSGSEDNTAKLWSLKDGRCIQTIQHPGCVWSTGFLGNGDFVTGCSDGVARIWSSASERRAPESVIQEFKSSCDAFLAPKQSAASKGLPDGLKVEDPIVLQAPGAHNGQTVVVAEGGEGGAAAYVWNASETGGEWERLGEVLASPEKKKKVHQGKEWDYIFDVDVADGAPPLKLAMDEGENPYIVADRFIAENDLPAEYKEQIVEFILRNTSTGSGTGTGIGPTESFVDPYTGHAAYVPPPSSRHSMSEGAVLSQNSCVTGGGVDPFTGGTQGSRLGGLGAYQPLGIPAKEYLCFDTLPPVDGLRKKINEFSQLLHLEDSVPADTLWKTLEEERLLRLVCPATEESPEALSTSGEAYDVLADSFFSQILSSWPVPYVFPWLDIARVAALSPEGARVLSTPQLIGEMREDSPEGSLGRTLATVLLSKDPRSAVPSHHVALRFLANAFVQPTLRSWVASQQLDVLLNDSAASSLTSTSTSKGVRLGLATLLLNYAVFLDKSPGDEVEGKKGVVRVGVRLLRACNDSEDAKEEEVTVRCVLALGTVLVDHSQVRAAARDAGLLSLLKDICSWQGQSKSARLKGIASQVVDLLRL